MHEPYRKGQEAMLRVQLRAVEKGWLVALPTVEARYDLILDDDARLYRAQVKYAGSVHASAAGAVQLDLRKETRHNGKKRLYSRTEIDALLVFVPQIGKVLWVGPELFDGAHGLSFRFESPKNGQVSGVRRADDLVW